MVEHRALETRVTLGPLGGGGCEGAVALLGELPPPQPLRLKQDATTSKTNKPTITEILLLMRSELAPESEDILGLLNPVFYYFDIICADKGNTGAQRK